MKDIEKAFQNYTHIDKIRVAKFVTQTITSQIPEITARDGRMNTVLGLLAKGDINCAGQEFDPNGDLFAAQKPVQPDIASEQRRPRAATEVPQGVIRTAEEIRRAEEEARLKREEEERIAREQAEEEERERQRIKKENSFWNKAFKGLKEFGKNRAAIVDFLKEIAGPLAASHGITVTIEPLCDCNVITTVKEGAILAAMADMPRSAVHGYVKSS